MKLSGIVEQFRQKRAALGLHDALRDFGLRAGQRLVGLKLMKGMSVSTVDPSFLDAPSGFSCGFLSAEQLRSLARDARYDLPLEFLDEALAKGDECYAIMDGETVAAYGWYAHTPTRIDADLVLHFDRHYVYMYKGLTLDAYRGKRLHAIGMTRALAAYLNRGKKGIVSYVDAGNLSSLRSVYRMGYVDFGQVVVARVFGRFLTFATPGCKAFDFRVAVERRAPAARPSRERESLGTAAAAHPN